MNSKDIEKIIRWAVDSDLERFAEDAYGVAGTAFDFANEGDHLRDKFKHMQSNFIMWVASLSENNRERLARNITIKDKEAVNSGWVRDTTIKDGKTATQGDIMINIDDKIKLTPEEYSDISDNFNKINKKGE